MCDISVTNRTIPEKDNRLLLFQGFLKESGVSPNTVTVYTASVRLYFSLYDELTMNNLLSYKQYLIQHYKAATVNARIYGINQYIRGLNLGAVICLPGIVLLDHHKRHGLQLLIGCEPLSAALTLSAPADGTVVIRRPGINDLCILFIAIWAFHLFIRPFLHSRLKCFIYFNRIRFESQGLCIYFRKCLDESHVPPYNKTHK